ncbi:hypothetical protein [Neptunomonas qingdaonensis]|uniref:Uncharacterized protein n=1 Tax=Neptunomonas qingdaonensis TaxID=1045558 RepID=A0A1I2UUD1_9GAMM|nr:hypothetical protein [Neptunomonas qingdaonensis]SFG79819.1 hypothetical protein SAMN05216175_11411 [Neptunomonas qingdaonensis]
MLDAMIIAIVTAVVGPVITILLTHYLQKRKKNGEHSDRVVLEIQHSGVSSPSSETLKTEDRTYYDQRVNVIMNVAAKRSAALWKGGLILFLLPIAFGVISGIATGDSLYGVAVWFFGALLAALAQTVELYQSKKSITNEITLSKFDRIALFEVKTRVENAKKKCMYDELWNHMLQTIDQELKNL